MSEDVGRYPQSTPDGDAIPFEIIRPYGLIIQPFTSVAVNAVALPVAASFLVLRAKGGDCLIKLSAAATVPADGAHTLSAIYVGIDEVIVIDHNGALNFGVVGVGDEDEGTLIVQTCSKYTDIRKSAQISRA